MTDLPGPSGIDVIDAEALTAVPLGAGLHGEVAFDTNTVLLAKIRLGEGGSGWLVHPERDAYGVIRDGGALFTFGPNGDETVEVDAGGFFHIPAGLVHRIVAPTDGVIALVAYVGTGEPIVSVDGPGSDAPEGAGAPTVAGRDDLVETSPLANLTRAMPFPDAPVQQVRGHADGRVASEWHHHGDNDVFGYVIRGEGYVEWGTGENDRKLAEAGEFFVVPAGVVHRDVNPSDDVQDYLLWVVGSEPRVVYVDGPDSDDEA